MLGDGSSSSDAKIIVLPLPVLLLLVNRPMLATARPALLVLIYHNAEPIQRAATLELRRFACPAVLRRPPPE